MSQSDRELVHACLSGDSTAWDALVDRYGRLVYSIPRRLGLGDADADDIFQSVMGIVLRRLASLRDENRLSAWLIRTTYRESWRHARRNRATTAEFDDTLAETGTPTDEQIMRLEREQLVHQALALLDPRCSELIRAFFFETPEPSYDEIANRMGMRIGSIGPTRARCFKKMERLLADTGL